MRYDPASLSPAATALAAVLALSPLPALAQVADPVPVPNAPPDAANVPTAPPSAGTAPPPAVPVDPPVVGGVGAPGAPPAAPPEPGTIFAPAQPVVQPVPDSAPVTEQVAPEPGAVAAPAPADIPADDGGATADEPAAQGAVPDRPNNDAAAGETAGLSGADVESAARPDPAAGTPPPENRAAEAAGPDAGDTATVVTLGLVALVGSASLYAATRRRKSRVTPMPAAEMSAQPPEPPLPAADPVVDPAAPLVPARFDTAREREPYLASATDRTDLQGWREAMVAAAPSAENPFLTRRNRLRRANFLLRRAVDRAGERAAGISRPSRPEPAAQARGNRQLAPERARYGLSRQEP